MTKHNRMITFENGIDLRARTATKPQVARFRLNRASHGKTTPNANEYVYCVIGTAYGYIHTSSGTVRTWLSYSGAHKAKCQYISN